MADLTLPASTLEYVHTDVTADADPLSDVVAFAFTARGTQPVSADWLTGEWKPGQAWTAGQPVTARILAGAGGTYTPTAGSVVDVWVRVTDNPEIPVRRAGTVKWT